MLFAYLPIDLSTSPVKHDISKKSYRLLLYYYFCYRLINIGRTYKSTGLLFLLFWLREDGSGLTLARDRDELELIFR